MCLSSIQTVRIQRHIWEFPSLILGVISKKYFHSLFEVATGTRLRPHFFSSGQATSWIYAFLISKDVVGWLYSEPTSFAATWVLRALEGLWTLSLADGFPAPSRGVESCSMHWATEEGNHTPPPAFEGKVSATYLPTQLWNRVVSAKESEQ